MATSGAKYWRYYIFNDNEFRVAQPSLKRAAVQIKARARGPREYTPKWRKGLPLSRQGLGLGVFFGCADEFSEQRMGIHGARLEFGVELAAQKPRVFRQFNDLYQ